MNSQRVNEIAGAVKEVVQTCKYIPTRYVEYELAIREIIPSDPTDTSRDKIRLGKQLDKEQGDPSHLRNIYPYDNDKTEIEFVRNESQGLKTTSDEELARKPNGGLRMQLLQHWIHLFWRVYRLQSVAVKYERVECLATIYHYWLSLQNRTSSNSVSHSSVGPNNTHMFIHPEQGQNISLGRSEGAQYTNQQSVISHKQNDVSRINQTGNKGILPPLQENEGFGEQFRPMTPVNINARKQHSNVNLPISSNGATYNEHIVRTDVTPLSDEELLQFRTPAMGSKQNYIANEYEVPPEDEYTPLNQKYYFSNEYNSRNHGNPFSQIVIPNKTDMFKPSRSFNPFTQASSPIQTSMRFSSNDNLRSQLRELDRQRQAINRSYQVIQQQLLSDDSETVRTGMVNNDFDVGKALQRHDIIFNGTRGTLDIYVSGLQEFIEGTGVSERLLMSNIRITLKDSAKIWYWNYFHHQTNKSLVNFIRLLTMHFDEQLTTLQLATKASAIRYVRGRNIMEHMNKVMSILRRGSISEDDILSVIHETLPEDIRGSLKFRGIKNVNDLVRTIKDLYPSLCNASYSSNIFSSSNFRNRNSLAEIETHDGVSTGGESEPTEEDDVQNTISDVQNELCEMFNNFMKKNFNSNPDVNKPRSQNPQNNKNSSFRNDQRTSVDENFKVMPGCFNCRNKDHLFKDCSKPQERLFCFTCGRRDIVSTKCNTRKCVDIRNQKN